MARFQNLSANVLTVCVHLLLCAALAFVGLFVQASFAEHLTPVGHPLVQGTVATLNSAAPVANAASDTPAGEPAKQLVADLASDHPDWLLTTAAPAVSAATVYRQVTFKLRRLPHPFPERPQRPPQIANTRV